MSRDIREDEGEMSDDMELLPGDPVRVDGIGEGEYVGPEPPGHAVLLKSGHVGVYSQWSIIPVPKEDE